MIDQADPRNPGPGSYKPMNDQTRENNSKGGKFGHDSRKNNDHTENPGPGTYGSIGGLYPQKGLSVVYNIFFLFSQIIGSGLTRNAKWILTKTQALELMISSQILRMCRATR